QRSLAATWAGLLQPNVEIADKVGRIKNLTDVFIACTGRQHLFAPSLSLRNCHGVGRRPQCTAFLLLILLKLARPGHGSPRFAGPGPSRATIAYKLRCGRRADLSAETPPACAPVPMPRARPARVPQPDSPNPSAELLQQKRRVQS